MLCGMYYDVAHFLTDSRNNATRRDIGDLVWAHTECEEMFKGIADVVVSLLHSSIVMIYKPAILTPAHGFAQSCRLPCWFAARWEI